VIFTSIVPVGLLRDMGLPEQGDAEEDLSERCSRGYRRAGLAPTVQFSTS